MMSQKDAHDGANPRQMRIVITVVKQSGVKYSEPTSALAQLCSICSIVVRGSVIRTHSFLLASVDLRMTL